MAELTIEKKPSKLPQVALKLGIAFIVFMGIQFLGPSIFPQFFYGDLYGPGGPQHSDAPMMIGMLRIGIIKTVCLYISYLCIGALFIFNAIENRNRNSVIAATIYTIAMLITIVLSFSIPPYLLVDRLPFIPIIPLIISLGFLADGTSKNKVTNRSITAILVCIPIPILASFPHPFIYTFITILLFLIAATAFGFLADRYRKDKTLFNIFIALIPISFILTIIKLLKPDFLLDFNMAIIPLASIAAIIYYFIGKNSKHKSIRFTYIAAIVTILYFVNALTTNLLGWGWFDLHVGDIFYISDLVNPGVFQTIFVIVIFGIFILPAIEHLGKTHKSNRPMLKVAKVLPFIAITLLIVYNANGGTTHTHPYLSHYSYYDSHSCTEALRSVECCQTCPAEVPTTTYYTETSSYESTDYVQTYNNDTNYVENDVCSPIVDQTYNNDTNYVENDVSPSLVDQLNVFSEGKSENSISGDIWIKLIAYLLCIASAVILLLEIEKTGSAACIEKNPTESNEQNLSNI